MKRHLVLVIATTLACSASSACANRSGGVNSTLAPRNQHHDIRRTANRIPSLIPTSTAEGVIGVPAGWRVYAYRSGPQNASAFQIVAPGQPRGYIMVRAVARDHIDGRTLEDWTDVAAGVDVSILGYSQQLGPVHAEASGLPEPYCVEVVETGHRYAACTVAADNLIVMAYVDSVSDEVFARLGGYDILIAVAAAGGGIKP